MKFRLEKKRETTKQLTLEEDNYKFKLYADGSLVLWINKDTNNLVIPTKPNNTRFKLTDENNIFWELLQ